MTGRRTSLRLRLMLGALSLAALAVFAAALAVHGLSRAEALGAAAVAAQQRMEAYAAVSARVNERVLASLASPAGGETEATAVHATLSQIDALVTDDIAAAPDDAEATRRAAPFVALARIRGHFGRLSEALQNNPAGSDAVMAALSLYGLQVTPLLLEQIDHERRRRDAAMRAMAELRRDLGRVALAVAIMAPLLLVLLWFFLLRPLWLRLRTAAQTVEASSIAGAPPALPSSARDELSYLFARINQMTNRLERRRKALAADYAQLEAIVDERTAELRAANGRLARIDAERRRFFADVSHELRTPLTVILGEAELGLRQAPPDLAESLTTIRSRAQRLFRRIEDLLRIARSESGTLDLECRSVDVARLADAVLSDLGPLLRTSGMRVGREIPEGLQVMGDPDWLRQVLNGIGENAVKYAGPEARLTITAEQAEDHVEIALVDDGPGLAPEIAETAFDRFARGPSAKARAPGFGVGLALARWVIEAQDGTIVLESPGPSGKGLRVLITLPLAARVRPDLRELACQGS